MFFSDVGERRTRVSDAQIIERCEAHGITPGETKETMNDPPP